MTIDVIFYSTPQLVSEVNAGMVLEALPGSFATALEWGSQPSFKDPTNVFGYVIGSHNNIREVMPIDKIKKVQRILPVNGINFDVLALSTWHQESHKAYLAIGELAGGQPEWGRAYDNALTYGFKEESLIFLDKELDEVRRNLIDYASKRAQKEYVFKTPGGEEYSLSQILLNLRPKS